MRPYTLALIALAAVAMAMYAERVPRAGSEAIDPCTTPLQWHIGAVDPRFDLDEEDVRRAVQQAAHTWEAAADRTFFLHRPGEGMSVNMVYDHRQESYERLKPHEARVEELGATADAYRARVETLQQRVASDRREYERSGSGPAAQRYQATVEQYNRAVDQYNLAAQRYNEAVEDAREAHAGGPRQTRAGDLQWTTQTVNGRVVSVQRTLTVGLVGSYEELVLILTHELGHALGLGHASDPASVMAESYRQGSVILPVRLSAADRDALAGQCRLSEA